MFHVPILCFNAANLNSPNSDALQICIIYIFFMVIETIDSLLGKLFSIREK